MQNVFHHVHRHIKQHHKKYLYGIFGGYAVVKLVLLVLGLSVAQYSYRHIPTYAQLESGCVLTGQYYTGEYQTGCIEIPEELTGGYLECETIPGYRTGGVFNESGDLIDQTRIEELQTGCVFTGQTIVPAYMTGCFLTGGYRTGGEIVCDTTSSEATSEITSDTSSDDSSSSNNTSEQNSLISGNGICELGDIARTTPLSGSSFRNIFSFSRIYSGTDCLNVGLSLQLWDHNNQRIDLASLSGGLSSYVFDSKSLYGFQYSGFYHIIGNTGAGNFMLYTGKYLGFYTRFFSGYQARLLTTSGDVVALTDAFTIDNASPSLSGISLVSDNNSTGGYVNDNNSVTLSFIASEQLSGVSLQLGSKNPSSSIISGLSYSYTWNLSSSYSEGSLPIKMSFSDAAGNTGALAYTSAFVFDITVPTINKLKFSGSLDDETMMYLVYTGSEPTSYTLVYENDDSGERTYLTGLSYLTSQIVPFVTGIEADTLYTFAMNVTDRAGNLVKLTGNVLRDSDDASFDASFYIVDEDESDDEITTGTLATLASTLKAEVKKFNECKEDIEYTSIELEIRNTTYIIQMPDFKKSQMKTLVNAFTLFVLDKMKNDSHISASDIKSITEKFDNFLVVLKLLRDDDNECKQNLSTYHITQFQKALEEYNITLE